jgi:cyclopropane-fatty-acyl-phospholipid synthase
MSCSRETRERSAGGEPRRNRWPRGLRDRAARRIVLGLLSRTRGGELEIVEGETRLRFGERVAGRPLRASVEVRSARFYRRLLGGSVGLCESYMDGLWECDDLVALTRIAALNVGALDTLRRALAPVLIPVQRWGRWLARNTPTTTSATSCSRCFSTRR